MLCRGAGALGAAAIGVNPMHALFAAEPRHFSPYSPSSRVWLELSLYRCDRRAGVRRGRGGAGPRPGGGNRGGARRRSGRLRSGGRRQAAGAGSAVRALPPRRHGIGRRARRGFPQFPQRGRAGPRPTSRFSRRCTSISWSGRRVFLAFMASRDARPALGRNRRIRPERASRVLFFQFLQWIADRQLGRAAASGREAGLAIGLYRDFAVGANPHGAEAWADNELVVSGASIGAPPDPLSRSGQNWGLAPLNPLVVAAARLRSADRGAARQYASCRHLADRPCHGAAPAVLGSERQPGDVGRLCRIPVRGGAAAPGARKPATPLRRDRRGSRHRAGRVPRHDAGRERSVLPGSRVRAARRRQLHAAGRIPAARRRLGRDARSGDRQGVLARARHRVAPAARTPIPTTDGRNGRGRGAPPRPATAARSPGWRGAARARAVRRLSVG